MLEAGALLLGNVGTFFAGPEKETWVIRCKGGPPGKCHGSQCQIRRKVHYSRKAEFLQQAVGWLLEAPACADHWWHWVKWRDRQFYKPADDEGPA
jgi:hypothetical protein